MKLVRTVKDKVVIRADLTRTVLSPVLKIYEDKITFIGTVLLVGPDVEEIKVGDRVHYGNDRRPIKVDTDKEDIVVIREDDIFIVVEDAKIENQDSQET